MTEMERYEWWRNARIPRKNGEPRNGAITKLDGFSPRRTGSPTNEQWIGVWENGGGLTFNGSSKRGACRRGITHIGCPPHLLSVLGVIRFWTSMTWTGNGHTSSLIYTFLLWKTFQQHSSLRWFTNGDFVERKVSCAMKQNRRPKIISCSFTYREYRGLVGGEKLETIHKLSRPQVLDRSKTAKVDLWENHRAGEL